VMNDKSSCEGGLKHMRRDIMISNNKKCKRSCGCVLAASPDLVGQVDKRVTLKMTRRWV
jgi:hypothetical protein